MYANVADPGSASGVHEILAVFSIFIGHPSPLGLKYRATLLFSARSSPVTFMSSAVISFVHAICKHSQNVPCV